MDKLDINRQVIEYDSKPFGDCYFQYKNIRIEIDEDTNIIRIMKGDKMVKFWYELDTIQTSKLPNSCEIIHEFNNVFENK